MGLWSAPLKLGHYPSVSSFSGRHHTVVLTTMTQCIQMFVVPARGLRRLRQVVIFCRCCKAAVPENRFDDPNMFGIGEGDRGGRSMAEGVRVDRAPEALFGQFHDALVDHVFAQ